MRRSVSRARGSRRDPLAGPGAVVLPLESRVLLAANPVGLAKAAEVAARVDSKLLALYDKVAQGADATNAAKAGRLVVDGQGLVSVTVRADNVKAVSAALAAKVGFQPTASRPDLHFVEGRLPINALKNVSKLVSNVGRYGVRPNYEPVTLSGSVNSQADFVMEADRVRATLPASINGAGQRVGVISDSYNRLNGAAAGIASGDLPSAGVTVLQDSNTARDTDEGRAMLELVHDIAPGASLAFATANGGEGNFAANIRRLANPADGNAKVLVDDIVYPTEPMFQDGVVAQAINEVVTTRGVNYFSAAGNQASQAYESTTIQTATDTVTFAGGETLSGAFFDFNPTAGTGAADVDTRQRITLPGGGQVYLTFQWDDPFYTTGGVDTDLDIFLINPATGQVVASSTYDNRFFDEPVEVVAFTNPSATSMALDVAIFRYDGANGTEPSANPGRVKYVNYGTGVTFNDAYAGINAPTLVPHAGAANGQGVAAARYAQQDAPEPFTSKGTQTVLFSPTGAPIAAETRNAPQVTGVDGTNTTFFGSGDYEADGRPNFFGTSAAAPHVAAVAALVRQANPGFTPAAVYQRLQNTADDIALGGAAPGFDNLTGFGLVNAYDAVYPTVTPASLNFSDGLEGGALSAAYETRSTGAGRIVVTPNDIPFGGVRHLTLDASVSLPSLNEVTLHVNASGAGTKTLSFRQREFGDEDDVMPATFTGSVNKDGVALSVDGVNWYRVVSLTGTDSTQSYALRTFDLSAIAAAAGLTLSADTRIRFQQYGDEPIAADGFAFDDITVTNTPVQSAAPGVPDLLPVSDTGPSDADDVTFRDNSAARFYLDFTVPGTTPGATVSLYADGVLIGTRVAAAGTTSTTVRTNGSVDLVDGVRAITARQTEPGKTQSSGSAALNVTVDTSPAVVTDVFVDGTSWSSAYRSLLQSTGTGEAAFGYRIPAGEQTRTMAWSNLNRISIRFSENVSVAAGDFVLNGVNVAAYGLAATDAFTYDPATFTATWTLDRTIPNDKVTINLDGDIAGTGVTDTAGNPLDGEWTNPVHPSTAGDTYPTGDGTPGGDFVFALRVLPGDIDRDGTVNIFDFNVLRPNLNKSGVGVLGGDINGDGIVNIFDFNDFRPYLNKTTPA